MYIFLARIIAITSGTYIHIYIYISTSLYIYIYILYIHKLVKIVSINLPEKVGFGWARLFRTYYNCPFMLENKLRTKKIRYHV